MANKDFIPVGGNSSKPLSPVWYVLLSAAAIGLLIWLNQAGKNLSPGGPAVTPSPLRVVVSDQASPALSHSPSPQNQQTATNDRGPIGSFNHQYLQADLFPAAVVEVDSTNATPPNTGSINALTSAFDQYADKSSGISRSGDNQFASQKDSYTSADIAALIETHRQHYSGGGTAALYVLYLNGQFADNPNALGVAVNASTMVIFKERINSATTALIQGPAIERAVLIHELGHLWGLVNLTYKSERNHEDAAHPGHSSNQQSVMFWAVEDINVANILAGGPPYQFDADDEFDINQIREGRY